MVVAVGKSMRGEEWGRGARLGDEAGGRGEAERTSGSSPVGMYFAFWKTRLFTIESGLPGKGQTSASASAPAQAWAWASAVTATEAGAGARDERGRRRQALWPWPSAACRRPRRPTRSGR